MNRNARTAIVVLIALAAASAASYGVYRTIRNRPIQRVEVSSTQIVAAARPVALGARLVKEDVKLVNWPANAIVPGSFTSIDAALNRGVISQLLLNEPVTESKLAPKEGGAGLPPTIPEGMRAISVRVNDVVGVAGFVVPGTRVDVFVTLQGDDAQTRTVVSNVQVLTAGTRYDQQNAKGDPIPTAVVTLLLTPEDSARVVLAANRGPIMLALRNPLDVKPSDDAGARMSGLFRGQTPPASAAPLRAAAPRRRVPAVVPAVAVTPPEPPKKYAVEVIRAARRASQTVERSEDQQ